LIFFIDNNNNIARLVSPLLIRKGALTSFNDDGKYGHPNASTIVLIVKRILPINDDNNDIIIYNYILIMILIIKIDIHILLLFLPTGIRYSSVNFVVIILLLSLLQSIKLNAIDANTLPSNKSHGSSNNEQYELFILLTQYFNSINDIDDNIDDDDDDDDIITII